jgi:hypothetical protein
MNGIVALWVSPKRSKPGPGALFCRNGGGGVRVNFRGNGSAVGLKLGGKVSAAARKVAGGVGGGDITMTCEPAPHVDASEPVVGLNMHPQWRRQSSELLGW